MRGVYVRLPQEAVDLLDAMAKHTDEVHPARFGRSSVLLDVLPVAARALVEFPEVRDALAALEAEIGVSER